jgi:hypothetical protein
MEDIEDLVVGAGAPPGFRLPLNAVGVSLKKKKSNKLSQTLPSPKIPGTQVSLSLSSLLFVVCFPVNFSLYFIVFLMYFCRRYILRHLGAHTTRQVFFFFFALVCI